MYSCVDSILWPVGIGQGQSGATSSRESEALNGKEAGDERNAASFRNQLVIAVQAILVPCSALVQFHARQQSAGAAGYLLFFPRSGTLFYISLALLSFLAFHGSLALSSSVHLPAKQLSVGSPFAM